MPITNICIILTIALLVVLQSVAYTSTRLHQLLQLHFPEEWIELSVKIETTDKPLAYWETSKLFIHRP